MTDQMLKLRERPDTAPVMRQTWLRLTFVHWAVEPEAVQRLLPSGLDVDLFDGKAYVSLVPFTMKDVAPVWMKPRPMVSDFHETNVRTYVHRQGNDPGVWFFSLEASKRLPVVVARRWFKLPYHFAQMTMDGADDACTYRTERLWPGPPAGMTEVTSRFGTDVRYAEPGTLEFWLLERYLLYSQAGHRLFTGQVHHTPYPFTDAEVTLAGETLTTAAGLTGLGAPNVAAQYSPGVSVEVFPLRPCD